MGHCKCLQAACFFFVLKKGHNTSNIFFCFCSPLSQFLCVDLYHKQLKFFPGHNENVHAISFSKDNRLLASAGADKHVHVFDLTEANVEDSLFLSYQHNKAVYCVDFHPNGKWVASGSRDKSVLIYDITTGLICHHFLVNFFLKK